MTDADAQTTGPLSPAQEALWYRDRLNGSGSTYNLAHAWRLRGAVDVPALRTALQMLVDRHPCLRTRFREWGGEPVQVVHDRLALELDLVELSVSQAADATQLSARLRRNADRPFDLTQAPLLRVQLYRLASEEYILQTVMHHIVTDGWSVGVFAQELAASYRLALAAAAPATGVPDETPSALPPLPLDFLACVRQRREQMHDAEHQARIGWWKQRLAGLEPLELPSDRPRLRHPTDAGSSLPVDIDPLLVERLRQLARRSRVTLFTLLLAVFKVLVHRTGGGRDIAVGVPTAGRHHQDEEAIIGFFVNMVVMRSNVDPDCRFDDFLRQVWTGSLEALENQQVPFETLVAELSPVRELNRHPLFQVSFALQPAPGAGLDLPGVVVETLPAPVSGSHFDLTLTLVDGQETINGYLEYRHDLFDSRTVEHFHRQYLQLLRSVCDNAQRPVGDLDMVDAVEVERLFRAGLGRDWLEALHGGPPAGSRLPLAAKPKPAGARDGLKTLFERQAAETPNAVAVVDDNLRLTYRELDALANQAAHWLRRRGIGAKPDTLVGVCLHRSARWVVGLLAAIKAGCAYVPLDPELPVERLALLLEESGATAVIAELATAHAVAAAAKSAATQILTLDETEGELSDCALTAVAGQPGADALAYLMYTSGSTGRPKGALIEAEGIIRLVRDADYVDISHRDRIAQASHAAFDAATFEVWGALLNGAELVIIDRDTLLSGPRLAQRLAQSRISIMFMTTALFNSHASSSPGMFRGLRTLLVGGEACDSVAVERVLAHGAPQRLVNVYGPTETTTFATAYTIHPRVAEEGAFGEADRPMPEAVLRHPIGRPIGHARCHVLDARGRLAPVGSVGEIHIGGAGLARGYLNDAQGTASRFVVDPFVPGERLYRSGDLARLRADGCIDFLGRADRQVKLRGFRIELAEIEQAMSELPGVERAAAIVVSTGSGGKNERHLHGFIVANNREARDCADWRRALKSRLPAHSVPSRLSVIESLPLTPNGKLDERALQAVAAAEEGSQGSGAESDHAHAMALTSLERRLLRIWRELLKRPAAGPDDDFIELGGHSLLALRLIAAIERETGRSLPLSAMLAAPTVRLQAALLAEMKAPDGWSSYAIPVQLEGSRPPLFLVSGYGGTTLTFKALATALGPEQPLYLLDTSGMPADMESLQALAASMLADMRRIQPNGPYRLCGHSLGGNIAWEIACQLEAAGEPAGLLVLLDCDAPGYPARAPLAVRLLLKAVVAARKGPKDLATYLAERAKGGFRRLLGRAPPLFVGEDSSAYGEAGRGLEQASAAAYLLWQRYTPGPWTGKVHVIRATQRPPDPGVRDDDPALGWEALAAKGVTCLEMDCRHAEMCRAAMSRALGEKLLACLADADGL